MKRLLILALILSGTAIGSQAPKETVLANDISEKQIHAINLINSIGRKTFETKSPDKNDLLFAYEGFMARFVALKAERESLATNGNTPDEKVLQALSERLDHLINDLDSFEK